MAHIQEHVLPLHGLTMFDSAVSSVRLPQITSSLTFKNVYDVLSLYDVTMPNSTVCFVQHHHLKVAHV